MKNYYCSECGLRVDVFPKAVKKYGRIINLVVPHKCLEEPVEFDLTPTEIPVPNSQKEEGKFVQKLNSLSPMEPGDKRPKEFIKQEKPITSSAPLGILDSMQTMVNTQPTHTAPTKLEEEDEQDT